MIDYLYLNNFKGFIDTSFSKLSRINVISGKNNAGKSSVLEAVFMFYDRRAADVFFKLGGIRGVSAFELSASSIWLPYFYNLDATKQIAIEIHDSGHVNKATYSQISAGKSAATPVPGMPPISVYPNLPQSYINSDVSLSAQYFDDGKSIGTTLMSINGGQLNLDASQLKGGSKNIAFVPSSDRLMQVSNVNNFGRLDVDGNTDKIINALSIIDDRLKSLSIIPISGQNVLHADIGLSKKIPLSYMGEGIGRLLSILLTIALTPNGIVCIDEIENGIHYSFFDKVWLIINKMADDYNCQLFITTHSHDALKGLYIANKSTAINNVSFYRIVKKNNDTKIKSYTDGLLYSAIDSEWEVR